MTLHLSTNRTRTETLTMAITERERRDIFNGFEATHGEEFANTIMELLPNQPADQLVTRTDMHAFGTELRGEMTELRADMIARFATAKVETQRLIVAGMAANAIAVITALAT
ncbi:MAG: hypothetical protein HKN91_15235 [Acidimicrobiia bacterium]|nr:hypothetical protein [Acidimicrobiia bacterium]